MNQEQALNDINVKVGRLEAMQENSTKAITDMAASVNKLVEKLDVSDDVAKEALEKSKSAHKRLDKIDKIIYWVATTIIGTVVAALLALVIK
ncbi:hypothetical protein J40TS1_33950 [Paenibacillus montaniterrae]|uniref:Hemolysin XhlA n=1 Tax=Paenibacillus montaniterrae TaxID=429341 RepID=A0A920CZR6_9BACL|nr:hemolysin XhlA family protein [Paenibacillus montaniterrae]GIP17753.1 hypothetical protein J40TS1_33950 [Paenibacillus montaniterrae]